jgi:imidazolonepropionase-like amidohydrolase
VRTIEHGTFIDEEGIELLKNSKESFMVPTAGIGIYCLDDSHTGVSEELLEKALQYLDEEKACVNAAYHAGLTLGFGSDVDMPGIRESIGLEFYARKEYFTFGDLDIVKQATINSAKIAGIDHLVGSVKEGKLADLIIVDGNPDEDVYVMKKPVVHVIRDGALYR